MGLALDGNTYKVVSDELDVNYENDINYQIENLKQQLAASDYKIIKCDEYRLAGKDLPYNIEQLHEQRQALRDKINELEAQA